MSSASKSASKLGDLLAQLPLNQPNQWSDIQLTAQSLANDLRAKNVEQQTALGQTLLPQTLTSLLKGATEGAPISDVDRKAAIYEILRAGANVCNDHDENRGYLLEAGFPQTIGSLLEGYTEGIQPSQVDPLPLSIPDLRIVKTAIGVLLNLSIGYEPVKTRLISLEAAATILKLSLTIYPAGSWLREKHVPSGDSTEDAQVLESWNLRTGLSSWAWRAISALREDDEENTRQLFSQDALPYLVRTLQAFTPPYSTPPPLFLTPTSRRSFIHADFDILEESCGLLESLAIDIEDVRLSLARGLTFPEEHGGVACLTEMLQFVDHGDYPPYWSSAASSTSSTSSFNPEREHTAKQQRFDICKAAIIKTIIEVAGEDKNTDVLWDDSEIDEGRPGGVFVDRMVKWVRMHKDIKLTNRDDLIICSTLSLGNLVRRETHSAAIVNPPISLSPDLAVLLEAETDLKVKHGVIGLLKHLAQYAPNRVTLGQAGVLQKLATCQVWGDKADVVETVQMSAIGVAKHMCTNNVENALRLSLPGPSQPPESTGLHQILALVRRSDTVAIKSEGTRVLVNVIKSIFTSNSSSDPPFVQKINDAKAVLVNSANATALAQLIGRSKKYPILINEGVMALTLLSTHPGGGVIVLDSLLNPLPTEANSRSGSNLTQPISAGAALGNGVEDSPVVVGPRRAMQRLASTLHNPASEANVTVGQRPVLAPPEVRANICSLVGHLGRKGVVPESRANDVGYMKAWFKEMLEAATKEGGEGQKGLASMAAKKALEAWET